MATKPKIKIQDIEHMRTELDNLYEATDQIILAKWSLSLAKHILTMANVNYENNEIIQEGFHTNEAWQQGLSRMYEVRQAGFRVHQIARESNDPVTQNALRATGQAVGSGHMREHAMVASDYAIKVINLLHPKDVEAIRSERQWQIDSLKNLVR